MVNTLVQDQECQLLQWQKILKAGQTQVSSHLEMTKRNAVVVVGEESKLLISNQKECFMNSGLQTCRKDYIILLSILNLGALTEPQVIEAGMEEVLPVMEAFEAETIGAIFNEAITEVATGEIHYS